MNGEDTERLLLRHFRRYAPLPSSVCCPTRLNVTERETINYCGMRPAKLWQICSTMYGATALKLLWTNSLMSLFRYDSFPTVQICPYTNILTSWRSSYSVPQVVLCPVPPVVAYDTRCQSSAIGSHGQVNLLFLLATKWPSRTHFTHCLPIYFWKLFFPIGRAT